MVTLPNRGFSVSREAQDNDLAPSQAPELVLEVSNVLRLAAAATAGQKDAATPLEPRSEDPEHARIRHEVQDQGEGRQQGPLATRGSVGDAENDPHSIRPRRGFFVRGQTGRSHIRAI